MKQVRTITGGSRFLHDAEGDGALEGIRHLRRVLQVLRNQQGRRPVHLLVPVIIPAKKASGMKQKKKLCLLAS